MPALRPGSSFPPLDVSDGAGRPARLPAGPALYVFFKTTCPTCELLWPYLERLRRRGNGSLSITAVSQDPPAETVEFARSLGTNIETLYDAPPWKASEALDLSSVPAFFLVDPEGRIQETFVGFQKAKMEELASRAAPAGGGGPAPGPLFAPRERVPEIRPG